MTSYINYLNIKINIILLIVFRLRIASILLTSSDRQTGFPAMLRGSRLATRADQNFTDHLFIFFFFTSPPFSIQGQSASGVMGSQKPGVISCSECPCLNDYRFLVLFIRSKLDSGLTYLLTVVLYCPQIGVLFGAV